MALPRGLGSQFYCTTCGYDDPEVEKWPFGGRCQMCGGGPILIDTRPRGRGSSASSMPRAQESTKTEYWVFIPVIGVFGILAAICASIL